MSQISSINCFTSTPNITPPTRTPESGSATFKNLLVEGLDQVNEIQAEANQAVEQIFSRGDVDLAKVLTAVQKADMAFRLMMQIQNKLVDAYREVSNIKI